MAWVKQIPLEEATGELKQIYDAGSSRADGVANIIRVMSQRPRYLGNMMKFYVDLMRNTKSDDCLTRPEREMLAAVTSRVNECHY